MERLFLCVQIKYKLSFIRIRLKYKYVVPRLLGFLAFTAGGQPEDCASADFLHNSKKRVGFFRKCDIVWIIPIRGE